MPLQISASTGDPLYFSEIRNEFGTGVGTNLLAYLGKGGVTGTAPLKILDFLGKYAPYSSTGWTDGQWIYGWIYGGGGYTSVNDYHYYGMNSVTGGEHIGAASPPGTATPYSVYSYPFGAAGSGNSLYTGSTTTSVVGIFDLYYMFHQNPGSTGDASYAIGSYLIINGNVPGTWWTSVTANGVTKNRSAASSTSGTYNSGLGVTYWFWSGTNLFSFDGTGSFSIAIS